MGNRALCVGINDYPGSNMDLAGCVNDASDWQTLLEARGYHVDALHDGEATRARIVDALDSRSSARPPSGDSRRVHVLPATVRGCRTTTATSPMRATR